MAGEGYPAGNGSSISASALLLRLTGAATLAVGAMLYGDGDATLATLPAVATGSVLASTGLLTAPAWQSSIALLGTITAGGDIVTTQSATAYLKANTTSTSGFSVLELNAQGGGKAFQLFTAGSAGGGYYPSALAFHDATAGATRMYISSAGVVYVTGSTSASSPIVGSLTVGDGATLATNVSLGGGRVHAGSQVLVTSGTITTSLPAFDCTQTWNAGGVTFTGWKLNVTDTASAAASLLLDLQVGGASKFTVSKAGDITAVSGVINGTSAVQGYITLGTDGLKINNAEGTGGGNLRLGSAYSRPGLYRNGTITIITQGNPLLLQSGVDGAAGEVIIGTETDAGAYKLQVAGNLYLSHGTITSAVPTIDSLVTWNAGGVTFTGWKLNVTNTASAAASLLIDLQVASTSLFSIRKDGAHMLPVVVVGGTVTASTPTLDATQTWNNGGVTFTGWKLNVTNTASATASLLLDLQVSGSSQFKVRKDGSTFIYGTTTTTATQDLVFSVGNNSSGTPAAGYGSISKWNLKSSTTNDQNAFGITVSWVVETHASRTARAEFSVDDASATRTCLRIEASGSAPMIGFLGAAAVVRATMAAATGSATRTTFDTTTVTTAQLAERVKALIDDSRSYGLHG